MLGALLLRVRWSSLESSAGSLGGSLVYLEEPNLLLQASGGVILVEPVARLILGYRGHNGLVGRSPPQIVGGVERGRIGFRVVGNGGGYPVG